MMKGKDRIEGDKIIIHDKCDPKQKVLKKVEIIKANGEKRIFELKRTSRGGYLFN